MARFKEYSYDQGKFIPIFFDRQILPGTFEYTLSYLIDNEVDLSVFEQRYRNDETGAPAYDPAILLKIILFAYSRGIVSSRQIAQCCRENIIFMALSADTRPHFTTIAEFISTLSGREDQRMDGQQRRQARQPWRDKEEQHNGQRECKDEDLSWSDTGI